MGFNTRMWHKELQPGPDAPAWLKGPWLRLGIAAALAAGLWLLSG